MDDSRGFLNGQLEDPESRKEWDETKPGYQIVMEMIAARTDAGMTQQGLSKRTGISRIENGNGSPSISTHQRIASALGKKLSIPFDRLHPAGAAKDPSTIAG